MKMLKLVMNMALVAMLVQLATAKDHIVGSPSGSWDPVTSLQTWAASQKFKVGDNLIFQYSAAHDVLEVTKPDYESCMTSNPLMIEMSGNTIVPLKAAGKRYFICGIPGHCSMGMKLEVDTKPATTNPPPTVPSPSPPTPSNPPPSSTPKTPSIPKSPFVPKSPFSKPPVTVPPPSPFKPKSPFSKTPVSLPPSSPSKPKSPFSKKPASPPPSSSIAPSKMPMSPTKGYAPVASPTAGGPTSPVGSPALATTASSTMISAFQPALSIAIAMALIAIHGF